MSCRCDKVKYFSRRDAKASIRRQQLRNGRLHAYECAGAPGVWHIGHMPQRVRNGEVDKGAWIDAIQTGRRRATFTPADMARLDRREGSG